MRTSISSKRLNPLNDYFFLKIMGEKGREPQRISARIGTAVRLHAASGFFHACETEKNT
jgi:hypothetical protein